ncbi:MAG: TonB family protein [Thiogranum sp.]|nr:TonB family protein [Thiogranum sp.]
MDFRFAGFISVSLLAHLALLVAGAESPTPKIGGAAAALNVTLLANHQAPATVFATETGTAIAPAPSEPEPEVTPARETPEPRVAASAHQQQHSPAVDQDPRATEPAVRPGIAASTATAATAPAPQVSKRISAALQRQFEEQFDYPWLARKRGWQGRVMLSLHIGKNGDLSHWKVARTSGYQVLDRSALDSARRIRSLPGAAGLLNGTALDLQIPVHYRLLDS